MTAPREEFEAWTDTRGDYDISRTATGEYNNLFTSISWHSWQAATAAAEAKSRRVREALERIEQWSRAYPLDVFPEPDMKRVAAVLKAAGLTLDAVSASNMRHVVEGVGEIARAALAEDKP